MRSNYELGVEKGREEGMEKGIEKGRKEGLEEGRLSVAKRLHLKGMPIADVADVTGLPETVIKDYLDT
jgi:predicted transposase/invertase (TIGR01784 family)